MNNINRCPICGGIHIIIRDDGNYFCESCDTAFERTREGIESTVEIYKKVVPSVLAINSVSDGVESCGTGIVVGKNGLILTSAHVLAGDLSENDGIRNFCDIVMAYRKSGDDGFKVNVVYSDSTLDLALLYSDNTRKMRAVGISDGLSVPGQRVCVIGNSKGEGLCVVDGIVSDANRRVNGRDLMLISAPVTNGYSGGPVIDDTGRLVGIVTGGRDDAAAMNYAVPARVVLEFLLAAKERSKDFNIRF